MTEGKTATMLRERLQELNSRDTFELGMYRLLAWSQTDGSDDKYHEDRLRDWSAVLLDLSAALRRAADR